MRQLIAKFLVFFILFANLAWAADLVEAGVLHADDQALSVGADLHAGHLGDGATPDSGDLKQVPCDHCCHGSAHYVGLTPHLLSALSAAECAVFLPVAAALSSRDNEPPLPPPNI